MRTREGVGRPVFDGQEFDKLEEVGDVECHLRRTVTG